MLATELGGVVRRRKAENAEDTKAIFELTVESYGRVDACLIHVGGPPKDDLLEIPKEDWDRGKRNDPETGHPHGRAADAGNGGAGRRFNRQHHHLFGLRTFTDLPDIKCLPCGFFQLSQALFRPLRPSQYLHELPAAGLH